MQQQNTPVLFAGLQFQITRVSVLTYPEYYHFTHIPIYTLAMRSQCGWKGGQESFLLYSASNLLVCGMRGVETPISPKDLEFVGLQHSKCIKCQVLCSGFFFIQLFAMLFLVLPKETQESQHLRAVTTNRICQIITSNALKTSEAILGIGSKLCPVRKRDVPRLDS